jgi:hypothetical protein
MRFGATPGANDLALRFFAAPPPSLAGSPVGSVDRSRGVEFANLILHFGEKPRFSRVVLRRIQVSRDFRQAEAETTGSVDEKDDLLGPLVIVAIAAVTSWRGRQQTLGLVKSNARSANSRPRCQQTDTHDLDLKPGLKV